MSNAIAIADVAKLRDHYDSREEEEWARQGMLWARSILGRRVAALFYHPLTFHLAGESYTPDWMCIFSDGRIAFFEITGSRKHRGYRDARSKLRAAAALFPCFAFYEAMVTLEPGQMAGCRIEAITLPACPA